MTRDWPRAAVRKPSVLTTLLGREAPLRDRKRGLQLSWETASVSRRETAVWSRGRSSSPTSRDPPFPPPPHGACPPSRSLTWPLVPRPVPSGDLQLLPPRAPSRGRLDPELLRQQRARGAWLIPGFPSARAGPAASAPGTPGGPAQAPSRLPAAGPRDPGLQISPGIPGRAGGGSVRPRRVDRLAAAQFRWGSGRGSGRQIVTEVAVDLCATEGEKREGADRIASGARCQTGSPEWAVSGRWRCTGRCRATACVP
ncbi:hypothetical protein H8959_013887 [Pygathrix nigripes]